MVEASARESELYEAADEDEAKWLPHDMKTGDTIHFDLSDKCGDELVKISIFTDHGSVEYGWKGN